MRNGIPDENPFQQRKLPGIGINYPYFTIGDLLEDAIIRLPYQVNSEKFYDCGGGSFLLPLTKTFFEFFTVEDLVKQQLLELINLSAGGIQVKLKIPLEKDNSFIEYNRIYHESHSQLIDLDTKNTNKGKIIDLSFGLAVYPFIKSDIHEISYRLGVGDVTDSVATSLSLKAFKSGSDMSDIDHKAIERSMKETAGVGTRYFIVEDQFDVIQVNNETFNINGFLIPLLKKHLDGGNKYRFSVDFGTTNTHIEYALIPNGRPEKFDIKKNENQIVMLSVPDLPAKSQEFVSTRDAEAYLIQELIPDQMGPDEEYNFPTRTVLLENTSINYNEAVFSLASVNIGFDYEKKPIRSHLTLRNNLKWSDLQDKYNAERIGYFIENLLMMIKHKVLSNNGNLNSTEVIWFYPISMSQNRRNLLHQLWQERIQKVFGPKYNQNNLKVIPESVAPFYYYNNRLGVTAMNTPTVSIDIGGGSSDVVIFQENEPKLITSFRFAGDAIFGDGYGGSVANNGFVRLFKDEYESKLQDAGINDLLNIQQNILDKYDSSTGFISFLFSLEKNAKIRKDNLNISFSRDLARHDEIRILFLIYYSALFYYIAKLMLKAGFQKPRYILFSGSASKTLKILDTSRDHGLTSRMLTFIFGKVYHDSDKDQIDVKIDNEPKEVTSRGGLYSSGQVDIMNRKFWLGGYEHSKYDRIVDQDVNAFSFKHFLSNHELTSISDSMRELFDIIDELIIQLKMIKEHGISNRSVAVFKNIRYIDLDEYLQAGLKEKFEESGSNENENIEETLFFYPLIGLLNKLASEIAKELKYVK